MGRRPGGLETGRPTTSSNLLQSDQRRWKAHQTKGPGGWSEVRGRLAVDHAPKQDETNDDPSRGAGGADATAAPAATAESRPSTYRSPSRAMHMPNET